MRVIQPGMRIGALVAGVVVFTLCLTGAFITFDRQIINWAERDARALLVAAREAAGE